ncbi:MAG: hypothetical protein AB1656_24595 [Candidatus Omnitrophota bacterium]
MKESRKNAFDPDKLAKWLESPLLQGDLYLTPLWNSYLRTNSPAAYEAMKRRIALYARQQPVPPGQIRSVTRCDPVSTGEILIGYDCRSAFPVALRMQDFFQHVIVVGVPGSGKTNLLKILLSALLQFSIPFLAFQKKLNQFEHLRQEPDKAVTLFHLDEIRDAFFETEDAAHLHRAFEIPLTLAHELYGKQDSRAFSYKALQRLLAQWPPERILREGYPTVLDLIHALREIDPQEKRSPLYQSILNTWQWIWIKNPVFHARRGMYSTIRSHATAVLYSNGEEHLVWLLAFLTASRLIQENNPLPPERKSPFFLIADDVQELIENKEHSRRQKGLTAGS